MLGLPVGTAQAERIWRMFRLLTAVALVSVAAGLIAVPSVANGQDVCNVFINDVPADDQTIKVDRDDDATITVSMPSSVVRGRIWLEFFGQQVRGRDLEPTTDGEWSHTIRVSEFAFWGGGTYKVGWEGLDSADNRVCGGSAFITVTGYPRSFTAVVAGVSVLLGLLGLTLSWSTTINEGARWTIKVTTSLKGDRDKERDRVRWKFTLSVKQTLVSTLWGLLLGGGTLVTLQQAGLTWPSIELGLALVLPITLLGSVIGTVRLERDRGG